MKTAIQELARQIRGGTIELLDATPPTWLTWAPRGTSNHVLWHAGHALWLQDAPWPVSQWIDVAAMIHAWHDEARHQGEMYLPLKLRRAADQSTP